MPTSFPLSRSSPPAFLLPPAKFPYAVKSACVPVEHHRVARFSLHDSSVMSLNFTGINVTQTVEIAEDTCKLSPFFSMSHVKHNMGVVANGKIDKTEAYASGYTYHEIILIVSAVATTLCLIFSVSLASVHLSNWVKPTEQKQ